MKITITSHEAARAGSAVRLFISLIGEGGEDEEKLLISSDEYHDMSFPQGEIDEDTYLLLKEKEKEYLCEQDALFILSYGDNNKAALIRKLIKKGHEKAVASLIADKLAEDGFIDETTMLIELILRSANEKLYAKRRIIDEMRSKGYQKEDILFAYTCCEGQIDEEENKKKLLLRKFGSEKPKPADIKEAAKIKAFLYRYGY